MSIEKRRPAGTSFSVQALGPDMALMLLHSCWNAYEASGDGGFDQATFERLTREGHIVNASVYDESFCFALMGFELMRDRDGPYTSFLYFDLWHGRLAPIAEAVITIAYRIAMTWHWSEGSEAPARLLLRGRDGWQRLLPRLGVEIDGDGWIRETQRRFGHGLQ